MARGCRLAFVLVIVSGAARVSSHHSFAMFDTGNRITIEGVVTAFEWTNPHSYIEVDVRDGAAVKHWSIELGSTSILMQGGWKFNDIKKGDKVILVVNPLRSGQAGGLLFRVTLADGRTLGNGPVAGGQP